MFIFCGSSAWWFMPRIFTSLQGFSWEIMFPGKPQEHA